MGNALLYLVFSKFKPAMMKGGNSVKNDGNFNFVLQWLYFWVWEVELGQPAC